MLRLTRTAIGLLTAQYRSVLRKCWAINVGLYGAMKGLATSAAAQMLSLLGSIGNGVAAGIDDVMLMFKVELAALMGSRHPEGFVPSRHPEGFTPVRIYGANGEVEEYITDFVPDTLDLDARALRLGLKMTEKRSFGLGITGMMTGAIASGVFAAALLMPTEAEAVKNLKLCVSQSATSTTPFQLVAQYTDCPSGYTVYGTFEVSDSTNAGAIAGQTTIALGAYASANLEQSVAIGSQSYAGGIASVAIGGASTAKDRTSASANESLAIMKGANASGLASIAIGSYAKAYGKFSIAQGNGAYTGYRASATAPSTAPKSNPTSAIAIGQYAGALTDYSIALGYLATAGQGDKADSFTNAIAIGNSAKASAANSVALGASSMANAENTVSVGYYNSDSDKLLRKIVNVADGEADTDAVNLGQMNTALAGKQDTISDLATIRSNASSAYTNVNNILTYFKFSDEKSGAASTATGSNALVIGSGSSYANGFEAIAIGNFAHANAQDALAVGSDVNALATSSTAIGDHASVSSSAANSVALGANSVATESGTVSVGKSGSERKIVNVKAGEADTDAVNLGQMNTALAGKQGTLTAGSNITISGNTISATDTNTTYSNGTGLSLSGTTFSLDTTYLNNNYYRKENWHSGQVIDFTRYLKNIKLAEKERFNKIAQNDNYVTTETKAA